MKRIGKTCISFVLLSFIIAGFKSDVHAEIINSGQVVDSHKIWTIKFNDNIKFDNFSKNYIKVTNSKGIVQESQLELCEDKKSIRVKPNSNGYTPGEKYTLKITKGLKSGKSKELKKETYMDFYIKQEGANDLQRSSPNNKENESLVVQDGEWVYYSDFTYNASIYKMRKDGTSKKLVYKGDDRICQLYASNGYIYFVSHSPYTKEEVYTAFRVKNDGSGKAETICYSLSAYSQFQIYENNIYYVDGSKLCKSDLNGKNPKELLNNIENKTDEVFFLIKDDLIYYWGFNYLTGKETGIYKMNVDGSGKQFIVKNTDAQSMLADTINVDDEYIYYKNFSGIVYKSDLKGNNIQKLTFLNKVSAINTFKGYIYYLCEGTIYKIKPDGTDQSIIAHQVDDDANYINIVNGYLWYFDIHDEIKGVALKDETNSNGLELEGNVSVKDGETFYVRGVNNPSSKIIKCTSEDVNGDGKKENIVLTGDYVNYAYKNLKLFVQDTSNGEIISYDALSTSNCQEVGNIITLGDFNKDKVKDIKIDLLTNMQRGIHSTYIYTLSNNKLNKIFDDTMIPSQGQDFGYELLSNRNIKISDNNAYYLVDLSKDNDAHYNNLMSTGLSTSLTIWYDGEDLDKDGSLELSRNIYLVGVSYSDFLCKVKTTYKFNQATGKWEYKYMEVESESYPCSKVEINIPNEEDNNEEKNTEEENNQTGNSEESNIEENSNNQAEDKTVAQRLVEKSGFVYYVQEQWTKSGEGYCLTGSPLYKVNKASGERVIIAKNCYDKIQIYGEWIYYISSFNGDMHKVKLDGTSDTNLSISGVRSFAVVKDWIYYTDGMYSALGGIYKMKLDGTEFTKLSEDAGEEIAIFDDWVYYMNSKDWRLCRVKADGTSKECLEEVATHALSVNKNGIYYLVRHAVGSSLHKMNHDGTNSKWILNGIVGRYVIYDKFIYYVDANNNCIYKMNLDGSGSVKLSDTKANDIIGVSSDSIYYMAGDSKDSQQVYLLKKDH
ncbi:DUF5050 domain-containing protein [Clostridium sp. MB40-C1]|uniref:DUF5050 domain-containing protein n=1 Tax=Clostridium sp. MB40-C1 TaxID=3070996 RepID=UPI0027E1A952|nr:DUF5050 domain-containing protein [Clostridium sp. MB40-C1]WMJ81137.1 DUF5050 domain-containing protein [Clostridium sp. MB40-C1]